MKNLESDGWYVDRVRGSHHIMKHHEKEGRVTIPLHKKDLKPKTLHTILKQAGLK
ncbi:type II toxin-antitoxin system HicA family toxin [Veillonella magna]|uniref:type II toxin-antitoxin system HicA family toxin n=1 Tax=Veillonella magna TaxID=464322 RepID=UPI0005714023|nr:type II toxin-antitoxin system HicA family toxin [Veillonella magna]